MAEFCFYFCLLSVSVSLWWTLFVVWMFFTRNFSPNMRLNTGTLGSQMEARRAINTIAVEQSHGGHVECGAGCDQVLRQSSAFEKTESGTRVKFDVH